MSCNKHNTHDRKHKHKHAEKCCCGCAHEHNHSEGEKINYIPYAASIALFIVSFFIGKLSPAAVIAAILVCGYDIFITGIKSLFKLKFNEATLILVAVAASLCLKEYSEAFMITLLFSIGELIEEYAVDKSRMRIESMIDLTDDTAYNELGEKIDAASIKEGDVILIKPGDRVCVDAKIIKGKSCFDTSNLTGESMPEDKEENDDVLSGSLNLTAPVICRATTDYSNSVASKMKEYVLSSAQKKAQTEKFITKFSKIYTPAVITAAIILAIALPIFGITDFKDSVIRALTFMIASCPCALVISVPLSYFGAVGAASRMGMLIKGSKFINILAKADAIAFDKTGTLTRGEPAVKEIKTYSDCSESEVLAYAASLEKCSSHPIAKAIVKHCGSCELRAENISEIFGKGITGTVGGDVIAAGNEKMLEGIQLPEKTPGGASIYVCKNTMLIGEIVLTDEIRPDAKSSVGRLRELGFRDIYLLSGDSEEPVERVCAEIGEIRGVHSLLPAEKLKKIEEIKNTHKAIVYVGDGVNDSPSLSASDFGISMGGGSGLALEAGDATLLTSSLSTIPKAVSLARYTMMIVWTNIAFSLLVKLVVLILAALGAAPVWLALFADVGVMIIAVLRSVTILSKSK